MNTVAEFPQMARSRFPDEADDIIHFRQKPHPDYPEFPCRDYFVSRADLESVKERGKNHVPARRKDGKSHRSIYDALPVGLATAYGKKHGWPFMIHIENISDKHAVIVR